MGELLARIRAMLRRREESSPDILRCGRRIYLQECGQAVSSAGRTGSVVLPRLRIPADGAAHTQSGYLPLLCRSARKNMGIRHRRRARRRMGLYLLSAEASHRRRLFLRDPRKAGTWAGMHWRRKHDPCAAEKICHHLDDCHQRPAPGPARRHQYHKYRPLRKGDEPYT